MERHIVQRDEVKRRLQDAFNEQEKKKTAWENREFLSLAYKSNLDLAAWIVITGLKSDDRGRCGYYTVSKEMIEFIGWEENDINGRPEYEQVDMLQQNNARLVFPCTPKQLIQFIDNDVSGCLGVVPEAFREAVNKPMTDTERRIDQIVKMAIKKYPSPLEIPAGGKTAIRKELERENPALFGKFGLSSFNALWVEASTKRGLVRMADSEKFSKRGD